MNSKETLECYLVELLSWEKARQVKIKFSEYRNNVNNYRVRAVEEDRLQLSIILHQYLTDKLFKRIGEAALLAIAVGNPPIHDLSIIECRQIKEHLIDYVCQSNNGALLGSILKFSLLERNGAWRIDDVQQKRESLPEEAWTRRRAI